MRAVVGKKGHDDGSTGIPPEVAFVIHGRCEMMVSLKDASPQQPHSERVSSHLGEKCQLPNRGPKVLSDTVPAASIITVRNLHGVLLVHFLLILTLSRPPYGSSSQPSDHSCPYGFDYFQVGPPTTLADPRDITETSSVGPLTTSDPSGIPIIDLITCKSVIYEVRDDLPGIRFTRDGHTEQTPVKKSDIDKATGHEEGDGTKRAPCRAAMRKLQLKYAKEVAY